MSTDTPTLSVIIPVYNEGDTLDEVLRQVLASPFEKQVLVVNDGSTDATSEILAHWVAKGEVEAVHHPTNRGKGAAIRSALSQAIGKFAVIQDGDLELNPADYPSLLLPLLNKEADFVIGSRFLVPVQAPWSFRAGVRLLNMMVRSLYGQRLTDEACCYKAMLTETLKRMDLQCERFEFCPEVVAKACRMKLRIREVPVAYHPRTAAEGKKLRYRDGIEAMRTLWRWRRWHTDCPDHAGLVHHGDTETRRG
ncbi:MAG: glycosyltransferase family 2 protein [Planctomycetaceae bacterium]|nr:glycosyltransferase family 2 protein [Planctomycetaceae bacterium]